MKTCSHVVHSMYWFDDWKGCCSHNKGVVFTLYMLLVACCLVWLSLFWSQLYCYVNNLFIAPANDRMEPLVSTQLWKHTFYHFKTTWKLSRWKTNFPKLLFSCYLNFFKIRYWQYIISAHEKPLMWSRKYKLWHIWNIFLKFWVLLK